MTVKTLAKMGLMTAMMLALGLAERQFVLIPAAPAIRLGLSNTVLLYAVMLLRPADALLLMGLKVLLGGLLYAGVVGAVYALCGGLLSVMVMLLLSRVRGMGFVGVSVAGAMAHSVGQILVSPLLLGSWAAALQLPLLLACSVGTGLLTGVIAHRVCRALAKTDADIKSRMRVLDAARAEDKP